MVSAHTWLPLLTSGRWRSGGRLPLLWACAVAALGVAITIGGLGGAMA